MLLEFQFVSVWSVTLCEEGLHSSPTRVRTAGLRFAAQSKVWECDRPLVGIVGSNPAHRTDVALL